MAIPGDIQQQVYDLLSRASNLSFVSAEQEGGTRISLTPGQRVTAEVLATLPNNQTQVRIGTERFNLELPMPVRTGQNLELTFVSGEPRSTFAIARQGGMTPPVSLSDASRLLGLLVGGEHIADPGLRSSLQSIGDLLRRSSGDTGVLANLMDEAITYGAGNPREGGKAAPLAPDDSMQQPRDKQGAALLQGGRATVPEQSRLAAFEANAARILENIARTSKFTLAEAVNQPVTPLPLLPGEEVDATVLGTLPGGRVFVQVAGASLELLLPRAAQAGDILRLTYISSQPKPLFAMSRAMPDTSSGALSEAGRWLSVLEHSEGGMSEQQAYVLERLNTVLKSLPADSPAFTAIQDEAITYQTVMQGRRTTEQASSQAGAATIAPQQAMLQQGNGIVFSDDMAKLLQALIKGNRLALLEALNQQAMPMGLLPGQQMKGEVMALLGGGRFIAQVAGQAFEFSMPKGTKPGDLVNLFFITDEPHPTFLMARFGRPGDSRVSDTGRWLSSFLGAAAEQASARETMGILRTLLAEPPADAAQLGKMLQQELRGSGLFYESHLASWFGGEYSLEDILREPQGRLSDASQPGGMLKADAQTVAEHLPAIMKSGSMEQLEALFKKAGSASAHEGIADARTLPMVREQLDALQSGQIVIRGELLPGQNLEWRVSEREARRNDQGEQERSWNTGLRLDLPRLGAISAKLRLDGTRVSIDISSSEQGTVEELDSGRPALVEQLQAAGLSPGEIGIRHEAP